MADGPQYPLSGLRLYRELVAEARNPAFVGNFVGPLCRILPETARFDKVFDKGLRQSGLNRWFWDKLYLRLRWSCMNNVR